jgi:hypothetical protein
MKRYAIIKDNIVTNVVEYAETPSNPPPGLDNGYIAIQFDKASPGWRYENNEFIPPLEESKVMENPQSLVDAILNNPTELTKLKSILGI